MNEKKISTKLLALKNTYGFCWVTLFISFAIGLLVSVILNIPIGLILGVTSNLADGITGTVATLITLFILSFRDGYYHNKFKLRQLLISVVLVFVLQVIITLVLGHSVWFTGQTVSFARYIFEVRHPFWLSRVWASEMMEKYNWQLMIIAYWLLYAPIMIGGKYLGAKTSKEDFANAKEEKLKEKTLNEHPFD